MTTNHVYLGICRCGYEVYAEDVTLFKEAMQSHLEKSHRFSQTTASKIPLNDFRELFRIMRFTKDAKMLLIALKTKRYYAIKRLPRNTLVSPELVKAMQ